MKRLSKISDPRMVSARVERKEVEKFATDVIKKNSVLTLQDFVGYAISLANDRIIIIDTDTNKFILNPEYVTYDPK